MNSFSAPSLNRNVFFSSKRDLNLPFPQHTHLGNKANGAAKPS